MEKQINKQQKHPAGLTDAQVLASRDQYGDNLLTAPKKESFWKQYVLKFKDPIIIILLVALALSFAVSCFHYFTQETSLHVFFEPVGILLAVLLATGISFYFENKANQEFELLNVVNDQEDYKVLRNGNVTKVSKKDIVVGDLIFLEIGEEVPADGILLEATSLLVNESQLTGELSVHKSVNMQESMNEDTYPANYLCRGTVIMDGHCLMKIEKVGDKTEYGLIFEGVHLDDSVKTPLNEQLERLARIITRTSYGIAFLVLIGRILVYFHLNADPFHWGAFGEYMLSTVMIAVTVIVVAVPEGLPMSVTLSLAYSMRSMMKSNNLVRKLHACETMGAATVICTDKTGTLTENKMEVYESVFEGEEGFDPESREGRLLIESMSLNTTAHLDLSLKKNPKVLGNPTEGALLVWLYKQNVNYQQERESADIIAQLPFSTDRKYMASFVYSKSLNQRILYVKGAPEIVMEMCKFSSQKQREVYSKKLEEYQGKAMRTMAFAYMVIDGGDDSLFLDGRVNIKELNFLGIIAINDPVRPDVPEAIRSCLHAGINVKIVTGDTQITAIEIAKQIGLWDENCSSWNHLTGIEFGALSDEQLLERISDLRVLSRARPMDKARLVNLLQQQGEVVAVTGDGTNDAPALKASQVGLSMGDGTSVAKEASDITLLDNSFGSILKAVMWGRSLYINIQRFVLFQMTVNLAACLVVLLGAFLGTESPLTVTQMLWVNLIMDTFAALALASLPPSKRVMDDMPRKKGVNIISPVMGRMIFSVGIFFVLVLIGFVYMFNNLDVTSLSQLDGKMIFQGLFGEKPEVRVLSLYEKSLLFSMFVFLQFWNMFNAKAYRSGTSALANLNKAKNFMAISVVILLGQILITSFGGEMFTVTPLKGLDWLIIISVSSIVLWSGEISRMILGFSRKA